MSELETDVAKFVVEYQTAEGILLNAISNKKWMAAGRILAMLREGVASLNLKTPMLPPEDTAKIVKNFKNEVGVVEPEEGKDKS